MERIPVGKASRRKALEGKERRGRRGGCSERVVVVAEGPREKIREKEGHETSRPRRLLRIRLSSGSRPSSFLLSFLSLRRFLLFTRSPPWNIYIPFPTPVFHAEQRGEQPSRAPAEPPLARSPPLSRRNHLLHRRNPPCETSPNKVPGAFGETASIFRSLHLRLSMADLRHQRRSGNLTTDHRTGPGSLRVMLRCVATPIKEIGDTRPRQPDS